MDFSGALDTAIGLIFIFLVFSLIVSGIYEAGARLVESRSRLLWRSLRELLAEKPDRGDQRPSITDPAGDSLTNRLKAHPLIRQLEGRRYTKRFEKTRVSHIPPTDFSRALVDILVPAGDEATSVAALRQAISETPDPIKRSLLPIASDAAATLDEVRQGIGEWFDTRMQAASRIYKRNTRWIMVVVGFVVVLAFNVDALGATQELYRDDAARTAIAEQAVGIVDACAKQGTGESIMVDQEKVATCAQNEIDKIESGLVLPVGWVEGREAIDGWHVLGWLVAAIAVAQGAPFWFDLLRRSRRVRG
jgi:hypothetical protein